LAGFFDFRITPKSLGKFSQPFFKVGKKKTINNKDHVPVMQWKTHELSQWGKYRKCQAGTDNQ